MLKNICKLSGTLDELLIIDPFYMGLIGSDGEDDGDTGSDDGDGDGEGDDDGDGDGTDSSKKDDKKDDDASPEVASLKRQIANFEEERDRWSGKLKKATDRVTDLEAEISTIKKDGTSDEKVKAEVVTTKAENEKLTSANTQLRIENAFLRDNTHDWVDPNAAMKLADLSDLDIDEKTGKVHGLDRALAKLAASSPYLLKPTEDSAKKPPAKKTGDAANRNKNGNDEKSQQAKKAKYLDQYPGLRR